MYSHLVIGNSLVRYGGIRVVRVSDDLGGSRGRGSIVARSAVVHSKWHVKSVRVQMSS